MFELAKYTILVVFLALGQMLNGQSICIGSQGDNIFLEGDFGSGSANVLLMNPGYAPGFTYTTNVAFDDGFYTITNNSALWANNFPTWLGIQDNSPDPFGYMMVVNANFQPGKFYEQIVDDLCENTTYNFTADVINFIRIGVGNHILPDVSFVLDGDIKFSSGAIPQDEKWHTYGFSFITGPGQTSVTLTLQNNAPGGIGNDLAIDNISFRPCGPNAIASTDLDGKVCADVFEDLFITAEVDSAGTNAFFQWQVSSDNGLNWNDIPGAASNVYQVTNFSEGNYLYRYVFAASEASLLNEKCRTFSTPQTLEVVPQFYFFKDTICNGNEYVFGNKVFNTSGTYIDTLVSSIGCDSIVTLDLAVVVNQNPTPNLLISDPTCFQFVDGSIEVSSFSNAYLPIAFFSINGNIIDPPYMLENIGAEEYLLEYSDHFGCAGATIVELVDPLLFAAIGQQDTIIRLGQTFEAATNFTFLPESIIWTPAEGLSCANCLNPTIRPQRDTTYLGIGFNAAGCIDTFKISVRVEESNIVFLPNVFSPNNDGLNDFFNAYALDGSVLTVLKIQIWDRWGGLIYEGENFVANDDKQGWNGEANKGPVENGVYSYVVQVLLINNTKLTRSGSVTIVR